VTFEANLRNLLLGDAALAAAVADQAANESRIYGVRRPEGQKNLRAIVYTVLDGAPAANLDAGDVSDDVAGDVEQLRVQIDIWAKSYDEARELARLVQSRMAAGNSSISATRISRQSADDPDTREFREILDYSVWHSPQ
jgi:hypothetical protein